MQEPTLDRLIWVTERSAMERPSNLPLGADSAISQDACIFGIDVDDYVQAQEKFGQVVWNIPWLHYTDQTGSARGCRACVVGHSFIPWMPIKRFVLGPDSVQRPQPKQHPYRLTLQQIADAIDAGGWPEDYWP